MVSAQEKIEIIQEFDEWRQQHNPAGTPDELISQYEQHLTHLDRQSVLSDLAAFVRAGAVLDADGEDRLAGFLERLA